MLPKSKMVRMAIESLYNGTCTVTVRQEYEKANGATDFKNVVAIENEPCHLSFSGKLATKEGEAAASVLQTTALFLSPDVDIPPGSRITVTQNGVTADYTRSGEAAKYGSHQEIILELWERWA